MADYVHDPWMGHAPSFMGKHPNPLIQSKSENCIVLYLSVVVKELSLNHKWFSALSIMEWVRGSRKNTAVWHAASGSAWPTAVCAVHCRALSYHCAPWSAATSVCWRMPSLPQHIRWRCAACSGQVQCVSCGCQCLAECKSTSAQCTKHATNVYPASRQDHLPRHPGARHVRRLLWHNPWSARLVTGTRWCDHVTSLLRQLHWLLVQRQITFKIMGLVHQSLAGVVPPYLVNNCRQLLGVICRPLRSGSNDIRMLSVPCTYNWFGDRSFTAAGPRLWNDLTPGLWWPDLTFPVFEQKLKMYLFKQLRPWCMVTFLYSMHFINTLYVCMYVYICMYVCPVEWFFRSVCQGSVLFAVFWYGWTTGRTSGL